MTSDARTLSPKRGINHWGARLIQLLLVALVVIFILAPVAWLVISSVSTPKDLITLPPRWLPAPLYLDNYRELIVGSGQAGTTLTSVTLRSFRYSLLNSFIVGGGVTTLCLLFGALAGYAFARLKLPFGNRLIYLLLLVQMIPVIVLLIPLYLTISQLGLLDRI